MCPERRSPFSGGFIGLGGAEFPLPILIAIFALYAHRAIRINLLISLVTLAMSAVSRLSFVHTTNIVEYHVEILGMLAGGIIAAWFGAAYLSPHSQDTDHGCDRGALCSARPRLLAVETMISGTSWTAVESVTPRGGDASGRHRRASGRHHQQSARCGWWRIHHPDLIFMFGADIRTAGTASVLISIPVVLTGVTQPLAHRSLPDRNRCLRIWCCP